MDVILLKPKDNCQKSKYQLKKRPILLEKKKKKRIPECSQTIGGCSKSLIERKSIYNV